MKPPPPRQPPPAAALTSTATATATALLGKYSLGRLLGRGSFAKVYQAHSLADGSSVAIKIIDKSTTMDAAMEPSIIREIAAMRRLHHHPNILKIHEVMATKSKIFLVMELATGGELFSKLSRRRRLSEQSARRYLQQLVSALSCCHENGVAHRDLKPQNLLLDKDGNLKVSDFGLSALPEQLKNGLLHTACGTPAYTAPEVACRRCGGYDGTKADAWSCGVILFVFLAGYLPFEDSNLLTMYKKIHRREYQIPDWVSKAARQVISQLLDPNPDTRLSLESLVKNSWFKKSLKSESQISFIEKNSEMNLVSSMNAFDIISLSSGLDLSGLFESTNNKREKRFTSTASFDAITGKVSEIGEKLGYRVEKGKSGAIGLGKGRWILIVEVVEIAPPLLMVELKVVEGGGVEFEEVQWGEFRSGLEEIIVDWHNDAM